MNWAYRLVVLLLCSLIASCGFHLRGSVDLPATAQPVFIQPSNTSKELYVQLRNLLREADIKLTDDATAAKMILVLDDQEQERRTVSVGTGVRAAEYQLFESVVYSLKSHKGKTLIGPDKLIEQRILPNNPNEVVSTGSEEAILRREMRQRLAEKIAWQLQAFDYQAAGNANHETAP